MANCKDKIIGEAKFTHVTDKSGVKVTSKDCIPATFDEIKAIIKANNVSQTNGKELPVPDELIMAVACKESGGLTDKTTRTLIFNLCAYTNKETSSASGLMGITKTAIKDLQDSWYIEKNPKHEEIHAKLCNDAAYSVEIGSLALQRKFEIKRKKKGIMTQDKIAAQSKEEIEKIWDLALRSYGDGADYSKEVRSWRDLLIENYTEETAQNFLE